MAVTTAIGMPAGAINYTHVTDTSADFASVANSTYFYNKADKVVRFKDSSGIILDIFSQSPFNAFKYNISNGGVNPTAGVAVWQISEGEYYAIDVNYTTLDNVGIGGYITNDLVGCSLLINIPTNASANSIMHVDAVSLDPSTFRISGTITVGNYYPNSGAGTLTFIP
jgi:hypothetical protein